jgi:hypothetical protein
MHVDYALLDRLRAAQRTAAATSRGLMQQILELERHRQHLAGQARER